MQDGKQSDLIILEVGRLRRNLPAENLKILAVLATQRDPLKSIMEVCCTK